VTNLLIFTVGGLSLIGSFIMFHQAWLTYKAYKNYNPDYISQRDEGCITDLTTGESKIQDKPVIPF